ncbi:MAG: DUF3078 domain-containing protein [Ignavibacteria bacterium]|nr:DUF3078 domain-containing protein [Ignavibacteria bacterium]
MIKKLFLFVSIFIVLYNCKAFAGADTTWVPTGTVGINVSQVSFSNWAQGGDNSISWTGFGNMGLLYQTSTWSLSNKLKIAYGRTKLGDQDYRTNDNELYFETVATKMAGWAVNPFFSNTVRTTLTTGYDYKSGVTVPISDFFDPGYISQSLGFTYKEDTWLLTRMGIALQEVFTKNYRQYSDDPATTDKEEAFKLETGMESVTDTKLKLDDNLLYQSSLRLFTRFNHLDVWDVRWDNNITVKATKYVNVNLSVLLVYEKSLSTRTQLKQALQMGVVYSIF